MEEEKFEFLKNLPKDKINSLKRSFEDGLESLDNGYLNLANANFNYYETFSGKEIPPFFANRMINESLNNAEEALRSEIFPEEYIKSSLIRAKEYSSRQNHKFFIKRINSLEKLFKERVFGIRGPKDNSNEDAYSDYVKRLSNINEPKPENGFVDASESLAINWFYKSYNDKNMFENLYSKIKNTLVKKNFMEKLFKGNVSSENTN